MTIGIPFNDTANLRLQIAEVADAILGDNVLAFQLGNEPDLYAECVLCLPLLFSRIYSYFASHKRRPEDYNQQTYFTEFGEVVNAIKSDAQITRHGNLVAPSLQGTWTLESVWDTGFLDSYANEISILAVEQ